MTWTPRRRTVIRMGLASTAVGLAGCSGGGSDETDTEEDEDDTASATGTATKTATASPPTATETEPAPTTEEPTPPQRTEVQNTPYANPEAAIGRWLSNSSNYDGNIQDRRGDEQVTVQVGTDGNGGNFSFEPVAVRIQKGDELFWQWTGRGGAHNVVAKSGAFNSGAPRSGGGLSFSHTFDETGLYLYECTVHTNFGMRGAVLVEEPQTLSGYPKVDNWLEEQQYSGRLNDRRNQSRVEISVGAQSQDGYFAFKPIAPLVDPGTKVVFDWSGRGGSHSITWDETPVDLENSGEKGSQRSTFSVTLDEPGVYLYYCGAHGISFGGRGAIVVNDA